MTAVVAYSDLEATATPFDLEDEFGVILPNGDKAYAPTLDAAILAADTLISDAAIAYAGERLMRENVIVTLNGKYHGAGTATARTRPGTRS